MLHGSHSDGNRTYERGDVVETTTDLNKMNSRGSIKFAEVGAEPSEPDESEVKESPAAS